MDLSSVASNSTPPRLVNSQLVSLLPVGILNLLCLICITFVMRIWSYSHGICVIKILIIIINYYYLLSCDDSLIVSTPLLKLYLRLIKMFINANCLILKPHNTGMTQPEWVSSNLTEEFAIFNFSLSLRNYSLLK